MTVCIWRVWSFCVVVILNYARCDFTNNSAVLISRYSKVAHWGQSSTADLRPSTEGRSASGQALWTHRSDANIVGGQNLQNNKQKVAYHYPVASRKSQRYEENASDNYPAVGEVQERFNAKPYFNYAPAPPQRQTLPNNNNNNNNRPLPPSTFYSRPSPDVKPVFANGPPSDSYNSPFNSYNPPAVTVDGSKDDDPVYPPIDQTTPSDVQSNIATPPEEKPLGYSYTPPSNGNGPYYEGPKKPSPPKEDKPHGFVPQSDDKPPDGDNSFYPPSSMDHHEVILDHPPPGYEEPQQDFGDMSNMDNHGNAMGKAPDMGEGDLNPPPSNDFNPYVHSPDNPEDPHDFGAYDFDHHHVYPVVEHPTTKEPPHDERVNKGHYSYYYLGRKLWYIPLYFSVYFIIYVTILILKSIARHKINFKHELHDKFSNRQARTMSANEDIDNLHRNVTTGIDIVNEKYMM